MTQTAPPIGSALEREIVDEPRPAAIVHPAKKGSGWAKLRDYLGSFLFVVPFLTFFVLFLVWPLVYAFWVSLHNWQTVAGNLGFIGLTHYYNLFFQYGSYVSVQNFWTGMENTGFFVLVSVPMLVTAAMIMALLLASGPFMGFFRTLYYVPAVLSITVSMTVWLWVFQNTGIADIYFHTSIAWLITQPYAWVSIFIATLWWTPGFNMVILLAGILQVPETYHEAAKIDGAGVLRRVWHITLPMLRPVLFFVIVTQMIASFGLFGQPFLLTGGGPGTSTTPVALDMYNEAFGPDANFGLAAAESFVLGVFMIILAVVLLRFMRPTDT